MLTFICAHTKQRNMELCEHLGEIYDKYIYTYWFHLTFFTPNSIKTTLLFYCDVYMLWIGYSLCGEWIKGIGICISTYVYDAYLFHCCDWCSILYTICFISYTYWTLLTSYLVDQLYICLSVCFPNVCSKLFIACMF